MSELWKVYEWAESELRDIDGAIRESAKNPTMFARLLGRQDTLQRVQSVVVGMITDAERKAGSEGAGK